MKVNRIAVILAGLMAVTTLAGMTVRPTNVAPPKLGLPTMVPASFGEWTVEPERVSQIIDPETQGLIDKIYTETLSRSYVNQDGYRIMLSLAYGSDQRGGLQAHRPEVCYPAQGFKVRSQQDGTLPTPFGDIEVRRLDTSLQARNEPVTYWLTVGNRVVRNKFEKRISEILLGLTGKIPDGMLFRVSSIDRDPTRAFAIQQSFVAQMMGAVAPGVRQKLSGLKPPQS